MSFHINLLRKMSFFAGIPGDIIEKTLVCFNAKVKKYKSDEFILNAGDKISTIGVIVRGKIYVAKDDYFGNRNIINELSSGDIFGEVFLSAGIERIPVSIFSETDSEILFIEYKKLVEPCGCTCEYHTVLMKNLLKSLSKRNLMLNEKIEILGKRNMRDKIGSYLKGQLEKSGKNEIIINFSRQELADFLCVDRSALCRELSKMQKEELIEVSGKKIKILQEF